MKAARQDKASNQKEYESDRCHLVFIELKLDETNQGLKCYLLRLNLHREKSNEPFVHRKCLFHLAK